MVKENEEEQNWLIIISLGVLALLATGVILAYARSVLIPFVLAIFISLLVSPVLDFQILKLKIPRGLAVILTLLFVMVMLVLLFFLISQAVQMIFSTLSRYSDSFVSFINKIPSEITIMDKKVPTGVANITTIVEDNIAGIASDAFGTIRSLTSNILFVSIFLIFLVSGRNPNKVRKGVYGTIDREIRRYIAIKTVLSLITGVTVWIVLELFRLDLAIVFGLLTFVLNFIPNIGSIIATCLPLPIAAIQFQDKPVMMVLVVLVPGAIQMTIGNLIEPKIMGQGLKLHPIVILLALSFWGLLWGITGMFLAVPITAAIRIILMQFETLSPVARILAGQLPGDV
ncbi:MAG: AI-2E family transporter [Planctomycetes bacterium]|nr:AI-2E family transporter [Planctomycetota bacterium]